MSVVQTIAKVFGLSLGIACLIKYGVSQLMVPTNNEFALLLVLLPVIVMMVWLARSQTQQSHNS